MKFLTKLGGILLKATEIATGFGPLIAATAPVTAGTVTRVTSDLEQLASMIGTVEAVGQALSLAGPQKLTAASPLVAQVILQSSLMAHHSIADPVLFKAGCEKIGSGMADVLNSLKDSIETTSKV